MEKHEEEEKKRKETRFDKYDEEGEVEKLTCHKTTKVKIQQVKDD